MDSSNEYKNKVVQGILDHILLEQKYVESYRYEENLVIVPLTPSYFSLHVKNIMPLQYLLLVEDSVGKIRRGDLVFFYPKDISLNILPKGTFHDFFTKESVSVDGTLELITLDDVKQYAMDFDNGSKKEFRLWQGKLAPPIMNTPAPPVCTQWTLVITDYNGDGEVIDVTEYDLGITCTGGSGMGGGNGGGDDDPNPVPSQGDNDLMDSEASVDLHIADKHDDHENWSVDAGFILEGLVNHAHPSDNIFTGIANAFTPNPGVSYLGTSGDPSNNYYCTWSTTQNNGSMNNSGKTCTVHVAGIISYIYQNRVQAYQKPGTWQAATTLH